MFVSSYRPILPPPITFGMIKKLEELLEGRPVTQQQLQALQNIGYLTTDQAQVLADHLIPDAQGNTLGSGALATKYGISHTSAKRKLDHGAANIEAWLKEKPAPYPPPEKRS